MRCTDCHAPIRPVVAIDIDGTLGDYHRDFLQFAARYMGTYYPQNYDGSNELHEYMGLSLDEYRQIKLAYRQGGGKRMMPANPGAGLLVERVHNMGAEVWITTTRPYNRFDSTDPDTRFWLQKHQIKYDHLLYDDDKYRVLAQHVGAERVVAVVDDLVDKLDEALLQFGVEKCIRINTRWNRGVKWFGPSADSLAYASRIIAHRVEEWYVKYGRD